MAHVVTTLNWNTELQVFKRLITCLNTTMMLQGQCMEAYINIIKKNSRLPFKIFSFATSVHLLLTWFVSDFNITHSIMEEKCNSVEGNFLN